MYMEIIIDTVHICLEEGVLYEILLPSFTVGSFLEVRRFCDILILGNGLEGFFNTVD